MQKMTLELAQDVAERLEQLAEANREQPEDLAMHLIEEGLADEFVVTEARANPVAVEVFLEARRLFGSFRSALNWALTPNRTIGGVAPVTLLGTVDGAERVRTILLRMEHGVYS